MNRHHLQAGDRPVHPRERLVLRAIGGVGSVSSLTVCVTQTSWPVGLVLWMGLLTAASLPVALVLTYRPRLVPVLAPAAWLIAVAGSLLGR
jgi:hypothetical protein